MSVDDDMARIESEINSALLQHISVAPPPTDVVARIESSIRAILDEYEPDHDWQFSTALSADPSEVLVIPLNYETARVLRLLQSEIANAIEEPGA